MFLRPCTYGVLHLCSLCARNLCVRWCYCACAPGDNTHSPVRLRICSVQVNHSPYGVSPATHETAIKVVEKVWSTNPINIRTLEEHGVFVVIEYDPTELRVDWDDQPPVRSTPSPLLITRIHSRAHTHTYTRTHTYTHTHTHTHTHAHTPTHARARTYAHKRTRTYSRAHAYAERTDLQPPKTHCARTFDLDQA